MPAAATEFRISDYDLKAKGRELVRNIEVFAVGRWNNRDYDAADLQAMVDAFEPTEYDVQPVITTNHGSDQMAGETRGYVTAVYRNEPYTDDRGRKIKAGDRLLVDALIDPDLVEEMKDAKFKRPSVEIKLDYEDQQHKPPKVWPAVLTAVSMIGGTHLPAVRVTEPLARTLNRQLSSSARLPLHYRQESRTQLITVDTNQEVRMDEVLALLQQLVAGQEQLLKGLPKTGPPDEGAEMKKDEKTMAEGGALIAPVPPAPAASSVTTTTPPPATPTSVTLKYSEQDPTVDALKARIQALELENAVTRGAAKRLQERDQVRAQVQKFSEPGNLRIAPAQVEQYTDLALSIPASGATLKFSDSSGKVTEMSPRDAFFAELGTRPDQTKMLRPHLVNLTRPASLSNVLAFSEQAEATAKEKGIPVEKAIQSQLDEITDVNELHALVFGDQGNNGNGSNSAAEA